MGVLFAICDALLLGTSSIFLKKSFKDFPPSVAFFIFSSFALLTWASLGLVLGVDFNQWFFGTLVGLLSAVLGQLIYIYVLQKGELSITATLLSSFPIYTIIFSILFINERPSTITLLLVLLAVLGTVVVCLPEKFNKEELRKSSFVAWAIFAAICIGASDTVTKFYINQTSIGSFLFYVAIAQFLVSFIYLRIEHQTLSQFKNFVKKFSDYKNAFIGSLLISTATMFLFLSFNFTLASIASPIAGTAPVITLALALIFLKEKIKPKNLIGLIMVLISIVAIGIVNP